MQIKALGSRFTFFLGVIWLIALVLAFTVGGHTGAVIGLIWVGTGIAAFVIAQVFHFAGQTAYQIYDDGLFAMLWGPIGLAIAFCRIIWVLKERRQTTT